MPDVSVARKKYVIEKVSRGKTYRYFSRGPDHRIRLRSDPGTPEFDAEYAAAVLKASTFSFKAKRLYPLLPVEDRLSLAAPGRNNHFAELERSARGRARVSSREYSLPVGWARDRFIAQDGACAVSGMQMTKDRAKRSPHAPSIDRIDSEKGYTPDNCRLVCYIVNCAKNMFTDLEFLEMCEAVTRKHNPGY